ncbi:MAG: glycoside hydrolase family 19 protein [Polyangiaceae bacterium]
MHDPDQVASDGVVSWKTALWFWMTAQSPKPAAHDVMIGSWVPSANDVSAGRLPGFGVTVDIINGGLECDIGSDSRVNDRIAFYQRYVGMLGVSAGDNVDCAAMRPF